MVTPKPLDQRGPGSLRPEKRRKWPKAPQGKRTSYFCPLTALTSPPSSQIYQLEVYSKFVNHTCCFHIEIQPVPLLLVFFGQTINQWAGLPTTKPQLSLDSPPKPSEISRTPWFPWRSSHLIWMVLSEKDELLVSLYLAFPPKPFCYCYSIYISIISFLYILIPSERLALVHICPSTALNIHSPLAPTILESKANWKRSINKHSTRRNSNRRQIKQ